VRYLKVSAQLLGNANKILGETVKKNKFRNTFFNVYFADRASRYT